MISHRKLESLLNHLLEPHAIKDYCPNGLQVEGRERIRKVVTGVTASQALIDAAVAAGADAILVHHGYFWSGEPAQITGMKQRRLKTLLTHDINLFAYHLPLDVHPEVGNNAQLARLLGLEVQQQLGEQNLLFIGQPAHNAPPAAFASASALAAHVQTTLQRPVTLIDGLPANTPITRLAWCSGGAQGYFEAAIEAGAQAFITGEISEPQAHYARECGAAFLACGHHATERYGVQALAATVAAQHGLHHIHIDIDNPA